MTKLDLPLDAVSEEEKEEIKEFVSTLLIIPKEDRAILLSNANAFKVRSDIEKAMQAQQDEPQAGGYIGRGCN